MISPRLLDHFSDLAARYDVLFCDVWGVIHDGLRAFPGAGAALARFRDAGGAVVLVSNVPRPGSHVMPMLDRLGVPRTAYDALLSSGDMTRCLLEQRRGARVHHLGPRSDRVTLDGLDIREVPIGEAEILVCTGLYDDREPPETYRPLLAGPAARGVPLICANPDYVVDVGGTLHYCAGALADLYGASGGEAVYCGKPFPLIYEAATKIATGVLGRPVTRERILAIGDAIRTDMKGADRYGIDALFVASGIHAEETNGADGPEPERLARLFAAHGVAPVAVQARLAW